MYDKTTPNNAKKCETIPEYGAEALVNAATCGRKIGRLILMIDAVGDDLMAPLVATWQQDPMVTFVGGEPNAALDAMQSTPGFFYNDGEAMGYDTMRAFLPWLEVWLVSKTGGWKLRG
ncbi:MAG: hypothetical protein COY40_00265 [Alphaproteobacteria bacterium CG_4_10_14_0_8_um_filter_53_9]|nr:MAG: hypothetical protein COY40_00265 [Alphaproteobacteria bacterium CG_4_10_14_0_8_um_filter_53_9]